MLKGVETIGISKYITRQYISAVLQNGVFFNN